MSFYHASKIIWFVAQPSSLVAILLVAGALLLWRRRVRWGRRSLALGIVLYLVAGFSPLGNWLLIPLEARIPRADVQNADISGIIVLGGALDTIIGNSRGDVTLNEAAERMTEAAALARRYPEAKIVFSGGVGEILYSGTTESHLARGLFTSLGISPERLVFENKSRNTAENAALTAGLLRGGDGAGWLLVTSAFHMPRATALFEAQDVRVLPWPVDHRTRGGQDVWRFFPRASEGLRRVDLATKEWAGLVVYWLRGLIPSPFPAPRVDDQGEETKPAGHAS